MVTTAILLGLLTVTTYTDVRWRRIYNTTTYPAVLLALAANAAATWLKVDRVSGTALQIQRWGWVGLADSLAGLAGCGAVMLVCYVFFAGGVGGGDIKLVAMMGAWLGVYEGLEAMLWTFILAGCAALIFSVWRIGAVTLLSQLARRILSALRVPRVKPLDDDEMVPLKTPLFLSPSALAATVIVRFHWIDWF